MLVLLPSSVSQMDVSLANRAEVPPAGGRAKRSRSRYPDLSRRGEAAGGGGAGRGYVLVVTTAVLSVGSCPIPPRAERAIAGDGVRVTISSSWCFPSRRRSRAGPCVLFFRPLVIEILVAFRSRSPDPRNNLSLYGRERWPRDGRDQDVVHASQM